MIYVIITNYFVSYFTAEKLYIVFSFVKIEQMMEISLVAYGLCYNVRYEIVNSKSRMCVNSKGKFLQSLTFIYDIVSKISHFSYVTNFSHFSTTNIYE